MPEPKRPLKVFLCHAHDDKSKARELYRHLRRRGIQPWLDAEDLLPGKDWQVEIPKALDTSDAIIICLSKNSVDKEGYVQKEIKFALDKALEMPDGRIFLIPARLEECEVPYGLRKYQWVDLFDEDGYSRLMKSLKERASQLERATVPISKQDENSPYLAEKPKEEARDGISVNVIGNVQGNIIIGSENAVQAGGSDQKDGADQAQKELELKDLESTAIKYELKGDFWNAVQTWYKIKKIDQLFPRVDIKIGELERELRPNPPKIPIPEAERRYLGLRTPIFVALIIIAVVLAALIGILPQLIKPVPAPKATATATISITRSPTAALPVSPPSKTLELSLTPIKVFTPTLTTSLLAEFTDAKGAKMRIVPEGKFIRGSNASDDEKPIRLIWLPNFYMDVYEVTERLYQACVIAGGCTASHFATSSSESNNSSDYPIVGVDWNQAKTYCEWREARLPTEAEWEKAARGTDGRTYPWGEGIDSTFANYFSNTGTTIVGSYEKDKSPYGMYDMAGNVSEWVDAWYDAYPDNTIANSSYGTQYRVLRGGSASDFKDSLRASKRVKDYRIHFGPQIGFRCARSVP